MNGKRLEEMTKKEVLFEILISLNKGNTTYANERVRVAREQYAQLFGETHLDELGEI